MTKLRILIIDKSVLKTADIVIALSEQAIIPTHFFIAKKTLDFLQKKMEDDRARPETKKSLEKLFNFLLDLAENSGGIEKLNNGGVSLDSVLSYKGSLISIKDSENRSSGYESINLHASFSEKDNKFIYAKDPTLLFKTSRSQIKSIRLKPFKINKGFRDESDLSKDELLAVSEGKSFPGLILNEVIVLGSKILMNTLNGLVDIKLTSPGAKIKGLNIEQKIAMYHLANPDILVVMMTGVAGVGKTFLTLLEFYLGYKSGKYKHLVITRANVSTEDNGYRPGTEKEKVRGVLSSINKKLVELRNLTKDNFFDKLIADFVADENDEPHGILKIQPLNDTQGETFIDSLMFFNEAQNAKEGQVKLFLSRAGRGSKVVLDGDLGQVQAVNDQSLSKFNNGLLSAERRMRNNPICAVIYSDKAEARGPIPKMISQVYNN